MAHLICTACQQECEPVTQDHGGYEEWWGRMVWHEQLVDVSDCCEEDTEEMGEEQ